ncbi:MAG: DNA replication/repair protein RecF [Actinomycetota bacterium]
MRVDRLLLEDFRNYRRAELTLAEGMNLVVGRNAQGKTNLLEGIYCLGGLGSPRGPDATLVREGADRSVVRGTVTRGHRSITLDVELRPGRGAHALVNKTPVRGTRALAEIVTCVFFGPDELRIVKGSPGGRRRFLDDLVVKLRPARLSTRQEWERVLRQRNALLKSAPRGPESTETAATLDVWEAAMSRTGAALAAARLEALGRLRPYARKRYEAIAGEGTIELAYSSRWLDEDACRAALEDPGSVDEGALRDALATRLGEVRRQELERGVSLVGPQRDDVAVSLGVSGLLDARAFASQGDQRTAALALKLGEHDLLADALGESPILLLDDVFSELDPRRREWLSDSVRAESQVVLTSAEPDAIGSARAERTFEVISGEVTEVG